MSRLLLSGIAALLLVPGLAFAYGSGYGGGSVSDHFSIGVEYNNMTVDTAGSRLATQDSPTFSQGYYVNSTFKDQSALLNVSFHSMSGFFFSLFGGMALNGEIDAGGHDIATGTNPSEAWTFNSTPTYGAMFGFDLFPNTWIHLTPAVRWQHAKFTGTTGSVYNPTTGQTYDYSSNGTTAGGYTTVGGLTVNPGTSGGTLATSFSQNFYDARVGLSFDLISDGVNAVTIGGGVEDAMTTLNGSVLHQFTGNFTYEEDYNFNSGTEFGYFAMLNVTLGPVNFGGEAHFTAEKYYVGRLAFNF